MRKLCLIVAIAGLTGCGGAATDSGTQVTQPTPDVTSPPNSGQQAQPISQRAAARFLLQASFGPSQTSIADVAAVGEAAWLQEQGQLIPSYVLPHLDAMNPQDEVYAHHFVESWWDRSVYAPDQLRQRVAFALSQIFVISSNDARMTARGLASYYDTLLEHGLGNYRELLEAVTLHPMMGMYLSMLGNEKPNLARNIRPDENFAREVMQLFSIGLVELNQDGSVRTDGNGQPIATYDQNSIKGFAHVFTGWHFAGRTQWWDDVVNDTAPMEPHDDLHDMGEKQLLNGLTLPAGQTARSDLNAALDNLFYHPNVGPFIGKQLIQRLVTSNPSPEYVARVAAVFADNGRGVRGDLFAVVQAILLDDEARDSSATHGGKIRMPLLRLAHILRAFDSTARDGGMGHEFVGYSLGLAPLGAPSVFNFYRPDYSLPGPIREQGLLSPELQITNEISLTQYINTMFYTAMFNNLRSDIVEDNVGLLNFDHIATLANDHAALVDYLDLVLLAGTMDGQMRSALLDALEHWNSSGEVWHKLAHVVYLAAISPQFAWQQ